MILQRTFHIITAEGEDILPDSFSKRTAAGRGEEIVLYLDANICFDAFTYFEGRELREEKMTNLETIILFAQQNKINIVPKFGCMELAYQRSLRQLDIEKYKDMVDKVTYTFDKPFVKGAKLSGIKFPDYVEVTQTDADAFAAFSPLLTISYITLLKLYNICQENTPKEINVRKNLALFCDWCDKQLNTSMASELQLAVKIFGGVSDYRRMIALDKKKDDMEEIFRSAWGTAFDFFHIRMLHFAAISSEMNYKPYFITQDKNIFALFKACQLENAITLKGFPTQSLVSNELAIHYKNDKIFDAIEDILNDFFLRRLRIVTPGDNPLNMETLHELQEGLEKQAVAFSVMKYE